MADRQVNICIVSSSRADWGLLAPVVAELRAREGFAVHLLFTGQHLDNDGASLEQARREGFTVDGTIDMQLGEGGTASMTRGMGRVVAGVGERLAEGRFDCVLLLGDRYEILCAAMAATVARVPIAHLYGGDVTEGAFDDAIRHAITKLSALHFVSTQGAARRVRQLGEPSERVHVVGSTGLDRIGQVPRMERTHLLAEVGLDVDRPFFLVTYHPETLAADTLADCEAMLRALDRFPEYGVLATGSNIDPDARAVTDRMRRYAADRDNAVLTDNLGSRRYFAALGHAAAVVGNSSSGLYEAPSFAVATVNIGDRQKGRERAASVIDVPADTDAVASGIEQALALDCSRIDNPYGDGRSAGRIVDTLERIDDIRLLLHKSFVDLPI